MYNVSCKIYDSDGKYRLREFSIRILSDSPIQHFESVKVETADKILNCYLRDFYGEEW